ncbi:hypothetical protein B0H10DRAFT_1951737 [Mycena sp. CBHHK59/15]|nr:hypothetical protein B0H10DRAFT_1951737 [Mycena sp. CBHHK59/15]
MTPFAREHIKHGTSRPLLALSSALTYIAAHHGRETCGVLAESTSHTIGALSRSIIFHFLNCFLLFFSPVLAGVLAFIVASYRAMTASVLILACHTLSEVDLLFPMFRPLMTRTAAVTPSTTVQDIREAVCERGFPLCHSQGPIYLMGLWRPLRTGETMSALGICGLRHFIMPPRLRGGAGDGTVVNEHGWEQGALNPDGSSKSAEDIDFGGDPRTPPPGVSGSKRPKRGKDKVFQAAVKAQAEEDSNDGQPKKKRKVQSRAQRSAKGNEKETPSDAEDSMYSRSGSDDDSDSDQDATITHEEVQFSELIMIQLAAGLQTKTVPVGSSRRPKDGEPKRARKKQKMKHLSDESLNPADAPSNGAAAPSNTADAGEKKERNSPSPMWLFWEDITPTPDDGEKEKGGDMIFRCRHGESKEPLRMTKAMKGSLTGLIGHLKTHAPDMLRFYEILNGKYKTTGLTEEEIAIAEGRKVFADRWEFKQFLNRYTGEHQQTLRESLERGAEKSVVSSSTFFSPPLD